MPTGQGLTARCALGVESTWGTGVAVTEVIPFTQEGIDKAIAQIIAQYLTGNAGVDGIRGSNISVQGDLQGEVVWDTISSDPMGNERLVRGALGASARDAGNGLNKYYINSTIDDSYTIAFNKAVSVWELQGCKISKLQITGQAGGSITFTATIIAANLLRTGDAGIVNAASALTSLSYTTPTQVIFDDLTFRVGTHGDALASGDQVSINNFTFTIDNKLTEPQFESGDSTHTNNKLTLEPIRNDLREVMLEIELPRYTTDNFFSWYDASTALQIDLKFATGSYEWNILLPNLKVIGTGAPIEGPGLIAPKYSMRVLRNNGVNTDMAFQDSTAIADEVGIEVKSDRTSAA